MTAKDQGSTPLSSKAIVRVHVGSTSVAPTWKNRDQLEDKVFLIRENVSVNYVADTLEATLANGGDVVYSILTAPNYLLELNGAGIWTRVNVNKTVQVVLAKSLDYEKINKYFIHLRAAVSFSTSFLDI